jgi:hypothetical protein
MGTASMGVGGRQQQQSADNLQKMQTSMFSWLLYSITERMMELLARNTNGLCC